MVVKEDKGLFGIGLRGYHIAYAFFVALITLLSVGQILGRDGSPWLAAASAFLGEMLVFLPTRQTYQCFRI